MSNVNDWGFIEPPAQFNEKQYRDSLLKYQRPIKHHDCERFGCAKNPDGHDFEDIWDDFELSQRQREIIFMEVVRSRGRLNREIVLLRQFQSTLDGSYLIRLQTSTLLTQERVGELHFDTRDECAEYYNYCIQTFGFTEVAPVGDLDSEGFFADLDEDEGDFFGDTEEGSFFDDLDDDFGWATDEDDDELSW